MAELVRYPTDILHAVYDTHRYTALDKLLNRLEDDYRRFYGQHVVLSVKVELWDRHQRQVRLYQQERQVLRAVYVLAHRQKTSSCVSPRPNSWTCSATRAMRTTNFRPANASKSCVPCAI